jgi:hypothetical protein
MAAVRQDPELIRPRDYLQPAPLSKLARPAMPQGLPDACEQTVGPKGKQFPQIRFREHAGYSFYGSYRPI